MKCQNCHKVQEHDVCASCWDFALRCLSKFPERYHALGLALVPSQGSGYSDKVTGSKTPPLPLRIDALHLRSGGISKPLMEHESVMRKQRSETMITFRGDELNTITETCNYLLNRKEWIWRNYSDRVGLVITIIGINKRINNMIGVKSDEIVIGSCPTINDDGETCNAKLKVNPTKLDRTSEIKCYRCETVWDSTQWRLLGRMLNAEKE